MSAVERAPRQWIIASEGWPFIGIGIAIALFGFFFQWMLSAILALCFVVFCLFFFRNPNRHVPVGEQMIVSLADGKIIAIDDVEEPHFLKAPMKKISIFMSVANAHVNRIPITGTVRKMAYYPGKFFCASFDKSSLQNERQAVLLESRGCELVFVQIAGLIARRIVCYLKEGDHVQTGERYGLIRFGSRLDLYLPLNSDIRVQVGQKVKAGRDILGTLL